VSVLSPGTRKPGRPDYHIESIVPGMVLSHFVTHHVVSDNTLFQTFFSRPEKKRSWWGSGCD
jgi:hypothetical protein